jgi:hypothetical protein
MSAEEMEPCGRLGGAQSHVARRSGAVVPNLKNGASYSVIAT